MTGVALSRENLTVLLNAFYELGDQHISVKHPADRLGELCTLELSSPDASHVSVQTGAVTYDERRTEIELEHGEQISEEIPNDAAYVKSFVASGLLEIENYDKVHKAVKHHGYRDLEAGHPPLYAGFDTNLLPWRIHDALELDPIHYPDSQGRAPVNGYTLPVGVGEELKISHRYGKGAMPAQALSEAFGSEFERLAGQPSENDRETRLGLRTYRRLSQSRPHDIVKSDRGDAAIIDGCIEYYADEPTEVLLFSNDYGFVEEAKALVGVKAVHVLFPVDIPRRLTGSWDELATLLYMLAVVFGVVVLPKVTLYGVWEQKRSRNWQRDELYIVPRSKQIKTLLERDKPIVEAHARTQ